MPELVDGTIESGDGICIRMMIGSTLKLHGSQLRSLPFKGAQ